MSEQRLTARVKRGLAWIVDDIQAHLGMGFDASASELRDIEDAVAWLDKFADRNARHGSGARELRRGDEENAASKPEPPNYSCHHCGCKWFSEMAASNCPGCKAPKHWPSSTCICEACESVRARGGCP